MQKFKQAIPFADQTPGYESDVVGRVLLVAREMGWQPLTAWLQWESNAERTVVAVVVDTKFRKLLKQVEQVDGMQKVPGREDVYEADGKKLSFKLRNFMNAAGFCIMVHKDMSNKRVSVMFSNKRG